MLCFVYIHGIDACLSLRVGLCYFLFWLFFIVFLVFLFYRIQCFLHSWFFKNLWYLLFVIFYFVFFFCFHFFLLYLIVFNSWFKKSFSFPFFLLYLFLQIEELLYLHEILQCLVKVYGLFALNVVHIFDLFRRVRFVSHRVSGVHLPACLRLCLSLGCFRDAVGVAFRFV